MIYSCKGCVRRKPGCHGTCPDYKRDKETNDRGRELKRQQAKIDTDWMQEREQTLGRYKKRMHKK